MVQPVACPRDCERCWTLLGRRRGRIWYARRARECAGQRDHVAFDGPWVLAREERRRDVVGFYHTHPGGPARPSRRDGRTMAAWCRAFGKPLLCVIAGAEGVRGYRFEDSTPVVELAVVELFPRGIVIGVEADGRHVSSRRTLPRPRAVREAGRGPGHAVRRRRARLAPG